MSAIAPEKVYTPEDLLALPDGPRYELIDGRLVEKPMGAKSSRAGTILIRLLDTHASNHRLGLVFAPNCGYQAFPHAPNRVRYPDASFVARDRLPADALPEGHMRIHPDLALEVVSPNDLAEDINARVADFLRAGTRLVWVIDPPTQMVFVYRAGGSASWLTAADNFSGEDVLPGFQCRVADLFAG